MPQARPPPTPLSEPDPPLLAPVHPTHTFARCRAAAAEPESPSRPVAPTSIPQRVGAGCLAGGGPLAARPGPGRNAVVEPDPALPAPPSGCERIGPAEQGFPVKGVRVLLLCARRCVCV